MNSNAREPECPRAGAVLAIHLDGDVDESGFGFVCGETLAAHLRECTSCQRLLQRARRLDAALASSAGRTLADHVARGGSPIGAAARRWFAAATAAPTTGPAPINSAEVASPITSFGGIAAAGAHGVDVHQRVATWSAAACVLICAITTVVLLRDSTPAPATAPPAVTESAVVGEQQDVLVAAFAPCESMPVEGGPMVAETTSSSPRLVIADDAVLRARREPRALPEQESVLPLPELQHRVADAGIAPPARVAAARALFAACHPFSPDARNATRLLIDLLASFGNRSAAERLLHGDLLAMARSTPHFLAWLQARLAHVGGKSTNRDDLAVLAVATRLDDRDLDVAVRRAVRKDPALVPTLAAALRSGLREDGAGALLLDSWHDLASRGALADDSTAAWSLFGGQTHRVFEDLENELHASRVAPRRLRCILGLGCAADDRTVPILLELLHGNDHAEAHAAAFALAGMPHRCLRPLLPRATANEGLLRAALARAALPETRSWPFVMALTPGERQLLSHATLAQFPEVAGWFRDRSTMLSD